MKLITVVMEVIKVSEGPAARKGAFDGHLKNYNGSEKIILVLFQAGAQILKGLIQEPDFSETYITHIPAVCCGNVHRRNLYIHYAHVY